MLIRLFFFLVLVAEVVALVVCLKTIGFLATLMLAVLAAMAGGWLLQKQGLTTLERFVTRLEFGEAPLRETWDGFCLMLAGFLLIIPGLVTDALALLLLVPAVRRLLLKLIESSGSAKGHYWADAQAIKPSRANVTVIEAEWREVGHDPSGPRA